MMTTEQSHIAEVMGHKTQIFTVVESGIDEL